MASLAVDSNASDVDVLDILFGQGDGLLTDEINQSMPSLGFVSFYIITDSRDVISDDIHIVQKRLR